MAAILEESGGFAALGEPNGFSLPVDSAMFGEARSFSMPEDNRISLSSRRVLAVVLMGIMLTMACLLIWFALVPRDDAGAAPLEQERVVLSDVQDQGQDEGRSGFDLAAARSVSLNAMS